LPCHRTRASVVLSDESRVHLAGLTRSREASVAKVERARIMLASADGQSVSAIARDLGTHRPKVERCLGKALQLGPLEA
jgi:hypothetical protein